MTTTLDTITGVYVSTVTVDELFADPTYQHPADILRARKMAATWDRRLASILEISDRGEHVNPRYAVIDGQHRWAAAKLLRPAPVLVANVHEGLTVADEAALFDKLNRQRKQPTTWDHWKARHAAGHELVLGIEDRVTKAGLRVSEQTNSSGTVWCISTLEKVAESAGGLDLVQSTLTTIVAAWGKQRAAVEAPMVYGLAMVLYTFGDRIDINILIDALSDVPPKRIRVNASTMRDNGMPGSLAKLSAVAMVNQYNQKTRKRLSWPNSWKGVLPKPKAAPRTAAVVAPQQRQVCGPRRHNKPEVAELQVVGSVLTAPRAVPSGLPPQHPETDQYGELVYEMAGRPVADVAAALGISERAVRRIRADLGLDEATA